MNLYSAAIANCPLFSGIDEKDLRGLFDCLNAAKRAYAKHAFVFRPGDGAECMGVLLTGCVHIVSEDFWGNRNIITEIRPGQVFAESYACIEEAKLTVGAVAAEQSEVLFLSVRRILAVCPSACRFHARLIRNLLSALAEKNLVMNEKLTHITQRTTRDKLLSYLSAESQKAGSSSFLIPFNRQQFADYLSVDRSALSTELGKLRDEGVLAFNKNRFTLL